MDIRAYFGKKSNTAPKSLCQTLNVSKKMTAGRKPVIDDSDSDEAFVEEKRGKKSPVNFKNKKRIIDSSDDNEESPSKKLKTNTKTAAKRPKKLQLSDSSSEEGSPKKKRRTHQSKLSNIEVKSKFFKRTTAADVFGAEPIKRSDAKLKEISAKLKTKAKQQAPTPLLIPDHDADFEATLAQLDEIGVDGWIPPSPRDVNLVKSATSKNVTECSLTVKNSSVNSNSDSGFDSQMSSSSQNLEEHEPVAAKPKFSEQITQSPTRSSPRKKSVNLKSVKEDIVEQKVALTIRDSISVFSVKKIEEKRASPRKNLTSTSSTSSPKKAKESISGSKRVAKTDDSKLVSRKEEIKETTVETNEEYSLWVEKHKPTNTKKIIGQQGDKSNVKKLTEWLKNWFKNNGPSKKAVFVPNGWNKDPTGACFKAALLSGPPGVGKTTSVHLLCKELGFDMVEFNASDTRSRRLLQEGVSKLLTNTSLSPYFSSKESAETVSKKHVLVMDEVDGMAGNEDRGGIQELIQLIKSSRIPVICMCNDRSHPKMRTLVNYCFDLRFSRPRVEQIKGYMRTVCFKEKLNIGNEQLTDIITSANNDIRLILNHLSMLAADGSDLQAAKKYIKLSAWDVLRKVFSKEDHQHMTIHDKCDLFFFDYNIAPLFVQENYLSVEPCKISRNDKRGKMEAFARAADCISRGDLIDKNIRQNMNWSLLPTQAVFASYAPGEILEGYCKGQIGFPSWLGKNSRRNKIDRLLQEVQIHTRLKLSASKDSINLDYAPHLRNQIIGPLIREGSDGVKMAVDALHDYQLLKDDLDSLQEICQWPERENLWASVDSRVKAAFTRSYNKNPPVTPYSLTPSIKKTSGNLDTEFEIEDEENDEDTKSDDETDAMIVTKKKTQPVKKTAEPSLPSSSKKATGQKNPSKRSRK